jgi:hypothetical protein
MRTLSRLYPDHKTAHLVVEDLMAAGLPEDDIGIISGSAKTPMENADTENTGDVIDRDRDGRDDRAEATGKGAAIGGAAGLLAGLSAVMIPGIGPVLAVGWVGTALAAAIAGTALGGAVGALTEAGISDNDAAGFAEGVRRGGTLLTIRVQEEDSALYNEILDASGIPRDRSGDPSGLLMPHVNDAGPNQSSEKVRNVGDDGWRDTDEGGTSFTRDPNDRPAAPDSATTAARSPPDEAHGDASADIMPRSI